MDCYGRSSIYWLESLGVEGQLPFTKAIEKSDLGNSRSVRRIRITIHHVLAQTHERKLSRDDPAIHVLGKCFLFLGDHENAAIAFGFGVIASNPLRHQAVCDACKSGEGILGPRYVCLSCRDTDLCEKCYKEYGSEHIKIKGCRDHRFLEIAPGSLPNLQSEYNKYQEKKLSQWLKEMSERGIGGISSVRPLNPSCLSAYQSHCTIQIPAFLSGRPAQTVRNMIEIFRTCSNFFATVSSGCKTLQRLNFLLHSRLQAGFRRVEWTCVS